MSIGRDEPCGLCRRPSFEVVVPREGRTGAGRDPADVDHVAQLATSRPTLDIVRWRWQVSNQLAAVVLDLEATSLFEISAKTAAALRSAP